MALTVLVAWLLGNSAHQSRLHTEQVRAQAATQAVTDERLRIARELHDVVAHTIGIVALQAGAARRVIDSQPLRAREALGEVENASRETLSGLRRMLGALRAADSAPTPLHEAPGLDDLDRLATATTAAGVRVVVEWKGSGGRCHRTSTCPHTASSRSRSPTLSGTPMPLLPGAHRLSRGGDCP